jgi:hypothetical protein
MVRLVDFEGGRIDFLSCFVIGGSWKQGHVYILKLRWNFPKRGGPPKIFSGSESEPAWFRILRTRTSASPSKTPPQYAAKGGGEASDIKVSSYSSIEERV